MRLSTSMGGGLAAWGSEAPDADATVEEVDHFGARGMRRVYCRGDWFGRHHSLSMDIWLAHDGRLLMKCWSRCRDIDPRSFMITGVDPDGIPERRESEAYEDAWIPMAVRQAYDRWISEEW